MILQDGGSITCRQKQSIQNQFQDTRSNTETPNKDRMCSQNNVPSNCCKAQQRLMNLMNTKAKNAQPKILTNASNGKKLEFSEPPFIYKVQNLECINASKTERKVRNVIYNGRNEYYHKNHDASIEITIENNCKKTDENSTKEKFNNQPQTSNRKKKIGNHENVDNGFLESNQKMKTTISFENNNSISENAYSANSTLKHFQHSFLKNEAEVSKARTVNKQVTAKPRPLTISEALKIHKLENEIPPVYKADCISKDYVSNISFLSSSKDNLPKVKNLKITELHENFLVEKLENPMKSGRNLSLEDKIDCDNQLPIKGFKPDDIISEFLSSDNVLPQYTSIPKNKLSRACHENNRNIPDGDQRFSISTKINRKGDIQKTCRRNTESQSDMYKKKRDGSTENNFTKSRNRAFICKKSKSFLSLDCSDEDNNKDHSAEKTGNLKTTLFRSSENLCSQKNYSVDTSEESFDSEEQNVGIRNNKGVKQRPGSNLRPESSRFTMDKLSARKSKGISSSSCVSSESHDNNDNKFSDPCLPKKDYSTIKKSPNSKTLPFKTDLDYSNRNSCDQSVPSDGFRKNRQNKALNDKPSGSALTSVIPIHKEPAKISHALSSKDLFKKYNASNRQQAFKYAKSHSDFNEIFKSSYLNPTGKDTTQNYSCLAQQRLLSCKSSKT